MQNLLISWSWECGSKIRGLRWCKNIAGRERDASIV